MSTCLDSILAEIRDTIQPDCRLETVLIVIPPSFSNLCCLPQTHSLTHRRAVPGRRKHFDILLAEHKGRPKEGPKDKDKEKDSTGTERDGGGQRVASHESASPSKPHCPNGRLLSSLKLRLANAHIPRSDTGNPALIVCIQPDVLAFGERDTFFAHRILDLLFKLTV